MTQRSLSAEVYWRRRLLLLAAVFLLAWAVVRVWPSGADAEPAVAPAATPTAPGEPSAGATVTPSPSPSTSEGPSRQTATVTLASATADCDPEQVRITPAVPSDQRAGADVEVDLVVSTTSAEPCTLRPADAEIVAVISAGKTAVWDSSVCKNALLEVAVALSPRWSTVAPTTWNGRGSGPTCSDKEGFAPGGTYTVRIGTLGGEPGKVGFTLGAKPKKAEKPEKSEQPDQDDETDAGEAD